MTQAVLEPFADRVTALWNELELAIRWDRPAILLAVYRSELVRAEVEATLRARLRELGHQAIDYRVTGPEEADIPRALIEHPEREDAVFFVSGLRADGADGARAYRALNIRREYFTMYRLRCIFWLTEMEAHDLPRAAPDFWAIRHRALEFVESPDLEKHLPLARALAWHGLSNDQDLSEDTDAKIALREALLSDLPEGEESAAACAELHYTLGTLYWAKDMYSKAEWEMKQALGLYRDLEDVISQSVSWNGLGKVYASQGRMREAAKAYKRAIQLDSNYAAAWHGLGYVYANLGRMEEAINAYEKAIHLDDEFAASWNNLGNVYKAQGRIEEAIEAYKRAIALDSSYASVWSNLGGAYRYMGRIGEALSAYEKSIELDANNAALWSNLGYLYLTLGREAKASKALERAVELVGPGVYAPWVNLGILHYRQGEIEAGHASFREALRRCTGNNADDRLVRAWLQAVIEESKSLGVLASAVAEASPALLEDLRGLTHLLSAAPNPPPNIESVRETLSA